MRFPRICKFKCGKIIMKVAENIQFKLFNYLVKVNYTLCSI